MGKVKDAYQHIRSSVSSYIEENNTWDEMRAAGLPVAGDTDQESAL
jgi:hypothetical protein